MNIKFERYRSFNHMPMEVKQSVAKMGFSDYSGHMRQLYADWRDKKFYEKSNHHWPSHGPLINSIVMYLDGKIIGWAAKYYESVGDSVPFASIWIQHKYRGKGLGEKLMNAARSSFKRKGAKCASVGWLQKKVIKRRA